MPRERCELLNGKSKVIYNLTIFEPKKMSIQDINKKMLNNENVLSPKEEHEFFEFKKKQKKKSYVSAYNKQYYKENKNSIMKRRQKTKDTKIKCECGRSVCKSKYKRHLKTDIHKKLIGLMNGKIDENQWIKK